MLCVQVMISLCMTQTMFWTGSCRSKATTGEINETFALFCFVLKDKFRYRFSWPAKAFSDLSNCIWSYFNHSFGIYY